MTNLYKNSSQKTEPGTRSLNAALVIDTLTGGGAERVVEQLALGLSARGHGAYVYCLKAAGRDVRDLAAAGVTVREARSRGKDFALAARLMCWMRRDRIDVVHAHSSAAFCWSLPAAKLLRRPIVLTRHGAHLGKRNFYPRWADRLIGLANRVTIVSESLRRDIPRRLAARRAVYVPNGIDCEPIPSEQARLELERLCGNRPGGPVVLSIGTISPEKDTLGLIEAFALLRLEFPEARLALVGGTRGAEYAAETRRRAESLGLIDGVFFLGHVDQAWRLIAGADVFCQGSRTEAMPIAILEAMSQAAPIVATAVGEIGRLDDTPPASDSLLLRHGETALLVPSAQPPTLAKALAESLRDPAAARARGRKAVAAYRRGYTRTAMIDGYERVYMDCLGRARALASSTERTVSAAKPGVVMLGPAPSCIGGMSTSIGLLMRSPLLERFVLHRLHTTAAPAQDHPADSPNLPRGFAARIAAPARHARALCGLAGCLLRRRAAVLHIHTCSYFTFYRNLVDLGVAKLLRRKVALHVRGGRFEQFCRESGRVGRWIIRRGLEAADAVILLSQAWRESLRPFAGRARLFVVPNAIDTTALPDPLEFAEARRQRSQDDNAEICRFLYLAPLTEAKGAGDLIEAARLLRDSGTHFEILVAGPADAADEQRRRQQVRDAALERIVKFIGPVRGGEKRRQLAAADVFVHPSRCEGMPNAVLEAGAAGLPVIATAVGAVPEMFREASASTANENPVPLPLVPPCDPPALAREMKRLAEDPELRRIIGRRLCRRFRQEYAIEVAAERIESIYRELTGLPAPTDTPQEDNRRMVRRVNAATCRYRDACETVEEMEHAAAISGE